MCTITFVPRDVGYYLAMNRDEKLSRIAGLPPKRQFISGHTVLFPSEPGGGTWISVNDTGSSFALINWYALATRVTRQGVSRGEVVKSLGACANPDLAGTELERLPLRRMNPFRLVGAFAADKEIVEWRWDLQKLERIHHPWRARQWISSGYDEPAAQQIRGATFREAQWQLSSGSLDWLRRLHRSHWPHRGAFSTCVHRSDAGTVSYTEISVSGRRVSMNYHPAAPCEKAVDAVCCCARAAGRRRSQEVRDSLPRLLLLLT